jgi:hypothetical protein
MSGLEIIKILSLNFKYHKIGFINPLFFENTNKFSEKKFKVHVENISPTAWVEVGFIIPNPVTNSIFRVIFSYLFTR